LIIHRRQRKSKLKKVNNDRIFNRKVYIRTLVGLRLALLLDDVLVRVLAKKKYTGRLTIVQLREITMLTAVYFLP